jgi:predicted DNA-binding ArsR family transcriptional regulator
MQVFQLLNSEEPQRRFIEVLSMKWSDYDDFERKYGSDEHPDIYGKRAAALYE